jgi:hypothetical protein
MFLILRIIQRDIIIGFHVMYALSFLNINVIWIFWQIWKCTQIWNFMKFRPVRAELFHADRLTGMELLVTFRNFTNAS